MKIFCISDTHGFRPKITKPHDIFIHAGDMSDSSINDKSFMKQFDFLSNNFTKWLEDIPAKRKVIIPGNHDRIFETKFVEVEMLRRSFQSVGCNLLIDQGIAIEGLKIYGTPWQPYFKGWSFNSLPCDPEENFLTKKFSYIPDNTDILISHAPPYGYLDSVPGVTGNLGSKALLKRIEEVVPKLVVCGHIHINKPTKVQTIMNNGKTILVNASFLNNDHTPNGSYYMLEI